MEEIRQTIYVSLVIGLGIAFFMGGDIEITVGFLLVALVVKP